MPHNLTPVSTFTAPVAVPSGGDERNAASVEMPFQALTNRTEHLNDNKTTKPTTSADNEIPRMDGANGKQLQASGVKIDDNALIVYTSPKVRSIVIPSCAFVPAASTDTVVRATDGSYSQMATDSAHFVADVSAYLNDRCTIVAYGVEVFKGASRAGGNAIAIKLFRNPYPAAAVQLGSGDTDTGGTGPELLDETLGTPHTVDRSANVYTLAVKVGNNAATFPDSVLYGFITVSEAGPGLGG